MPDDNIVSFPVTGRPRPPQTIEEVREAVENITIYHVDECMAPLIGILTDSIASAGFDLDCVECAKDMAMVYTSLRSMLLKMRGISHPFQAVAADTFDEKDGNVTFRIGGQTVAPFDEEEYGEEI